MNKFFKKIMYNILKVTAEYVACGSGSVRCNRAVAVRAGTEVLCSFMENGRMQHKYSQATYASPNGLKLYPFDDGSRYAVCVGFTVFNKPFHNNCKMPVIFVIQRNATNQNHYYKFLLQVELPNFALLNVYARPPFINVDIQSSTLDIELNEKNPLGAGLCGKAGKAKGQERAMRDGQITTDTNIFNSNWKYVYI